MGFRFFVILTAILLVVLPLFNVQKNTPDWTATVGIIHKPDNIAKTNQEILNEKFSGHYIDRALSYGEIIRWNPDTFPLKVYIENNPKLPDYYYKEVKKAFLKWQEVSDDFITFKFVQEKNTADIKCSFPTGFDTEKGGDIMIIGGSSFNYKDGMLTDSEINFSIYNHHNEFWKSNDIYSTALHEIGHSLGIKGHSTNREDIMYPISSHSTKISSNDINTLKFIYSIVPDISNKEFPQEVREKFMTADDVFGKDQSRFKIELESTKDDIKNTGGMVSSKTLRLGYLYYKTAQYTQAKNVLEPMLETHPNEPQVYRTLAKVYKKQKDFEALDKLYVRAQNIFPDNPPIQKN